MPLFRIVLDKLKTATPYLQERDGHTLENFFNTDLLLRMPIVWSIFLSHQQETVHLEINHL